MDPQGTGDRIGIRPVVCVPEPDREHKPLFSIDTPESSHAPGLYLLRGRRLHDVLEVLGVIVLTPENHYVFQPAADEQLTAIAEAQIPSPQVGG